MGSKYPSLKSSEVVKRLMKLRVWVYQLDLIFNEYLQRTRRVKVGVTLQDGRFVWDENKHKSNIQKHDVSFQEAATVFDDDNAIYFDDEAHSEYEERFRVIGFSERTRILMVCHCYRNGNKLIRIISARKANKKEVAEYRKGGWL